MKTNEYLEDLRSQYKKTDATWHLKMSGWDELQKQIGFVEKPLARSWFENLALTLAVLIFLLGSLLATYKIASAAMPGDPFYPVKLLSERIIQGATGDNQVTIDHRADEIIGLSQKENVDREQLKMVVSEYTNSVEVTKTQIETSGKQSVEFQKRLEDQHSEFDKVSHQNPEIRDEIKDAQDVSDHSEGKDN